MGAGSLAILGHHGQPDAFQLHEDLVASVLREHRQQLRIRLVNKNADICLSTSNYRKHLLPLVQKEHCNQTRKIKIKYE